MRKSSNLSNIAFLMMLFGCSLTAFAGDNPFGDSPGTTVQSVKSASQGAGGLDAAQGAPALPPPTLPTGALDPSILGDDYRTYCYLLRTADGLYAEMDKLCKSTSADRPLTQDEEQRISYWFASMLNIRTAFIKIAKNLQKKLKSGTLSSAHRVAAWKLGYACFVEWYRFACFLHHRPLQFKPVKKKMNEAVPELGIPADHLTKVLADLGNIGLRESLDDGFEQFWKVAEEEHATTLLFQRHVKWSFEYIGKVRPNPWAIKIKTPLKDLGNKLYEKFYKVDAAVSTWIGDTKYLPRDPTITHQRVAQMTQVLKPGDILLERENWFLSNLFLPGFWKHGIIYVGTADDLRAMGLDTNPIVARHLARFAKPDQHGYLPRVVEAISDGVVMNTMEEATDADYICALRPRLAPEQIKEAIIKAFSYIGRPYDFQFDFQTEDKLVCSELVYRCYSGFLHLPLQKMMGRWALPSVNMVAKWARERSNPDRELDFVFFLDSDPKTQKTFFRDEEALAATPRRPGLDVFLTPDPTGGTRSPED